MIQGSQSWFWRPVRALRPRACSPPIVSRRTPRDADRFLEHERLGKDGVAGEAVEPVRREVERRFARRELLRDRLANRGCLHEAMAGEPTGRIDALPDPADDGMRVRRHVVETRPRASDADAGC